MMKLSLGVEIFITFGGNFYGVIQGIKNVVIWEDQDNFVNCMTIGEMFMHMKTSGHSGVRKSKQQKRVVNIYLQSHTNIGR